MLLAPAVRGLLGLEADAPNHTLRLAPQLPANWDEVTADHVPVGDQQFHLEIKRVGQRLQLDASSAEPTVLCLTETLDNTLCRAGAEKHHLATRSLPPVEVALPPVISSEGARTSSLKVIQQTRTDHSLSLILAAPGTASQDVPLRVNDPHLRNIQVEGATRTASGFVVAFEGSGYQQKTVTLRW